MIRVISDGVEKQALVLAEFLSTDRVDSNVLLRISMSSMLQELNNR